MRKKVLWMILVGILLVLVIGVLAVAIIRGSEKGKGQVEESTHTAAQETDNAGKMQESVGQSQIETDDPNVVIVTAEELIGPWHPAEGENDDSVINDTFPGAMEFGCRIEFLADGKVSWYLGADGGNGTYSFSGNKLCAELTNDLDGTTSTVELTAEKKDGRLLLVMDYRDVQLRWAQGKGETGKGE